MDKLKKLIHTSISSWYTIEVCDKCGGRVDNLSVSQCCPHCGRQEAWLNHDDINLKQTTCYYIVDGPWWLFGYRLISEKSYESRDDESLKWLMKN